MKRFKSLSLWMALLPLPMFVASSVVANADTYRVEFVHYDQQLFYVYGIDSHGTLTALIEDGPCGPHNFCVGTYTNAVLTGISPAEKNTSNPPSGLAFDNGTPCSYSVLAGATMPAICNNGRTAFLTDLFHPDEFFQSLYIADASGTSLIANLVGGRVLLNAEGDIFFDDTQSDKFYEAFRVAATPEPSTLALLGTGLLGLGNVVRRRLR